MLYRDQQNAEQPFQLIVVWHHGFYQTRHSNIQLISNGDDISKMIMYAEELYLYHVQKKQSAPYWGNNLWHKRIGTAL